MNEKELLICIKMDLALNNLQGLICHKIQTNKQTTVTIMQSSPLATRTPSSNALRVNILMEFKLISNISWNRSICFIDWTQTNTTTSSQSGLGSNGKDCVILNPHHWMQFTQDTKKTCVSYMQILHYFT